MIPVQYPEPDFQVRQEGDRQVLFDRLRKKWVTLTPEEWVRQNFIRFIVDVLGYPATLVAVEKELRLGELTKRFDILVHNRELHPWMMIECKAMNVKLNDKVLDQLLRYHISIPVEYLVVTNGGEAWAWQKREGGLTLLTRFPDFP